MRPNKRLPRFSVLHPPDSEVSPVKLHLEAQVQRFHTWSMVNQNCVKVAL